MGEYEDFNEQLKDRSIIVAIADDKMSATVRLGKTTPDFEYTYEEVMSTLNNKGIKTGVDEERVRTMVFERAYERDIVVAVGKEVEHGEPGRYEFMFDENKLNGDKPTVRADGSVDYFNVKLFEKVNAGDKIATYYEPTKGNFGFDVCGKLLVPKPGKPMPKLRGKGFKVSDDGTEFFATIDGKIEYSNYNLNISPVFDVNGDVDLSVGNIDFNGDVSISGGIRSGVTVHAMGNLFVGGYVESANLKSGKDIVLQDGVNAKNIGVIEAEGSISAPFFENTKIFCKGDLKCGYLLNCEVLCYGKIYVEGEKGSIIGGDITGVMGVDTNYLGNSTNSKTIVRVGSTKEIRREYAELIMKLKDVDTQIETFDQALEKFELLKQAESDKYDQEMVTRVFQSKIVKKAEKTKLEDRSRELFTIIRESETSVVRIDKNIYPGARVLMDDKVCMPESEFKHILIKKTPTAIVLRDYDDI